MSIAPHGGTLVNRLLTGSALEEAKKKAEAEAAAIYIETHRYQPPLENSGRFA